MTLVTKNFDFNKNTYSIKADGETLAIESNPKKDSKYTKEDRLQELVEQLEGHTENGALMSQKNVQVLSPFVSSLKVEIENEQCEKALQDKVNKVFQTLQKVKPQNIALAPKNLQLLQFPNEILMNVASFLIQDSTETSDIIHFLQGMSRAERESLLIQDAKNGSKILSLFLIKAGGIIEKLPFIVRALVKKRDVFDAIKTIDLAKAVITPS